MKKDFKQKHEVFSVSSTEITIDICIEMATDLVNQGLPDKACAVYAKWLHQKILDGHRNESSCAIAWFNLGVLRSSSGRLMEAVAAYRQALRVRPDLSDAWCNLGLVLERQGQHEQALSTWSAGLPLVTRHVHLLNHIGRLHERLGQYPNAEQALRQSLTLHADQPDVVQHWVHLRAKQCRWPTLLALSDASGHVSEAHDLLAQAGPFASLALTDDPVLLRTNTERWLASRGYEIRHSREKPSGAKTDSRAVASRLKPSSAQRLKRKLRIGYASADLHHHATGMLMVQVLELFNKQRFEQLAFSWGPEDGSLLRKRLRASFDSWHEVGPLSDAQVLEKVCQEKIDIWVDLKGLTHEARPGLFAKRVAPIQVNFLGYPGSLPLRHIDYCLADSVIAPPELRKHFAEAVVCMPDTYQPNDRARTAISPGQTREELGLPPEGFVFCSFNANYKITPSVFSVWMRLLLARPGSVLWLIRSHPVAEHNLRDHATALGVDPARLVFSPIVPIGEHLARQAHADLFLDTFPCGAHTTASDALWMGLPVLTCVGRSFASRVAASLLTAAGVPQLIAPDLPAYEKLAFKLSGDPSLLDSVRQQLLVNRDSCPLFDSERYTRHLEDALALMWLRHERGLEPADMEVPTRAIVA